jgi:hypothetical protein
MNKRFRVWAGIFLAGVGFWALLWFWIRLPDGDSVVTEKDVAKIVKKMAHDAPPAQTAITPIDLKRPLRLAIGSLGPADEQENRRLSDLVLAELSNAPGLNLVERQSLEQVLREINLSLSSLVRAKDAIRVGKILKADWFLLGTETKNNGTNSLLVRVVDARTGILREAGVFSAGESPTRLATDIAGFVRQTRQDAAAAKPRVYLAIGSFKDVGLNSRQAAFPTQLRSYLTAAYQHTNVTLLEREAVSTLLQEVRLDLAGLTEEGAANAPQPMQSAYWLVGGSYQSYETTNYQVELVLEVSRMFGRMEQASLRGPPDESLFKRIKGVIDFKMAQNAVQSWPTKVSEARAQMGRGRELVEFNEFHWDVDIYYNWTEARRRNIIEAVRAFETALLLQPTNREAKIYLARCLRQPPVGRTTEARDYYREILEEPVQDACVQQAQLGLRSSFFYSGPQEKARWFASAIQQSTNPAALAFYRANALSASKDVVVQSAEGSEAIELAKERLLGSIRSCEDALKNRVGGCYRSDLGMDDFLKAFGDDKAAAAHQLSEFLPQMKAECPELTPYLTATVLTYQTTTNTPLVQEFEQILGDCVAHPERVLKVEQFWAMIHWSAYDWCFERTNYALAVKLIEAERRTAAEGHLDDFDDMEKIKLAYAYLATKRWQDALDIFDSFSKKPVEATHSGPWGRPFIPILTDKMATYCRNQLGLPSARDPREFDIGPNRVCMHTPSAFAADSDGLWMAIAGQLIRLSFDLQTNLIVRLPVEPGMPLNCLCLAPDKIWIGTGGAGLVEFSKADRKCRRLTQSDGLMLNYVSQFHLAKDSLWIGYGRIDESLLRYEGPTGGGLGQLDLRSMKCRSYMPSLNPSAQEPPPRTAIKTIAEAVDGDLWMHVGGSVRQLHVARDSWETFTNKPGQFVTCFAMDPERMITGVAIGSYRGRGGLEIHTSSDNQWQHFEDAGALPEPPTAMVFQGHDLWVGGEGYIALVDLTECKVRKFSRVPARSVDCIAIAGGYIWAQFDWHLHRVALNNL